VAGSKGIHRPAQGVNLAKAKYMTSRSKSSKFAQLVAALRDGPLTPSGAAEMLGIDETTAVANLRALEAAGVAVIDRWKKTLGSPAPIYVFCYEPGMVSAPRPPARQVKKRPTHCIQSQASL